MPRRLDFKRQLTLAQDSTLVHASFLGNAPARATKERLCPEVKRLRRGAVDAGMARHTDRRGAQASIVNENLKLIKLCCLHCDS
jgi:hypothetical protein